MGLYWKSELALSGEKEYREQTKACAGFSIQFLAGNREMITRSLKTLPPFSSITSIQTMADYYEGHLGQASAKVFSKEKPSGISIDRERLSRWPEKFLPRLLHEAPEGYATMCIIENPVGRWAIYFKWEPEGFGETLRRELERVPIDHSNEQEYQERQWLLEQLKEFNLLLAQVLRSYPNITFQPNPKLIQ
jgi:hypothetical protein